MASSQCQQEVVKLLLGMAPKGLSEQQAAVLLSTKDKYDSTALHLACDNGYIALTVCFYSCRTSDVDMIELLADAGADIDDRDDTERVGVLPCNSD